MTEEQAVIMLDLLSQILQVGSALLAWCFFYFGTKLWEWFGFDRSFKIDQTLIGK